MLLRAERLAEQQAKLAWYLARVVSPSVRRTRDCLKSHGFENFLPLLRIMKRKPQRMLSKAQRGSRVPVFTEVDRPLWQGYLLVRFDMQNEKPDWRRVFADTGLAGFLGDEHAKFPYRVPGTVIDVLRELSVCATEDGDGAIPASMTGGELERRLRTVIKLTSVAASSEAETIGFAVGETVRIDAGPFTGLDGEIQELPDVPLDRLDESDYMTLLVGVFGGKVPVELPIGSIRKKVGA